MATLSLRAHPDPMSVKSRDEILYKRRGRSTRFLKIKRGREVPSEHCFSVEVYQFATLGRLKMEE